MLDSVNNRALKGQGFILAAPSSNSGKTLVTAAILAALKAKGVAVSPFKVGPDYIDPGYLAYAAEANCRNLDPWGMRPETRAAQLETADGLAIIEGVMGLFDGAKDGTASTADLAVELGLPVVLVVDARGLSHSAGALVHGYASWRHDLPIAGVIFNRVGSEAHYRMLCQNLSVPSLGYVKMDGSFVIPNRHLGLVLAQEADDPTELFGKLGSSLAETVNLDALLTLAQPIGGATAPKLSRPPIPAPGKIVAVAQDEAFAFVYPHLLLAWQEAGAEVRYFSPLDDEAPADDADSIYLPGGYPELYAAELAQAETFKAALQASAKRALPIYGECGGYMVLGKSITDAKGGVHAMTGLLPVETSFAKPKRRLGYRHVELKRDSFLGKRGASFRGHEFHMTAEVTEVTGDQPFRAWSSDGDDLGAMGAQRGSVLGSYLHLIDRV